MEKIIDNPPITTTKHTEMQQGTEKDNPVANTRFHHAHREKLLHGSKTKKSKGIQQMTATCLHPTKLIVESINAVLDMEMGKLFEYRHLIKHPKYKGVWNKSAANEFGQQAQGVGGRIKGTDTVRFIQKEDISKKD